MSRAAISRFPAGSERCTRPIPGTPRSQRGRPQRVRSPAGRTYPRPGGQHHPASLSHLEAMVEHPQPLTVPAVAAGSAADQLNNPRAVRAHPPHAAESRHEQRTGQKGRPMNGSDLHRTRTGFAVPRDPDGDRPDRSVLRQPVHPPAVPARQPAPEPRHPHGAVTQIRHRHSDGRAYYDKKIAEGKTPKEALRRLKRRISNAI